jgi:hypothetical protein
VRSLGAACAAILLILEADQALAASRPAVFPAAAGPAATYDMDSITQTEQGTLESTGIITLTRRRRYDVEVEAKASGAGDQLLAGYVARDGSIDLQSSDAKPLELERLNLLALLVGAAPAAFNLGDAWTTTVKQGIPGDSLQMPVTVRVTKLDDAGLELTADGKLKTTLTASDAPVSISDDAGSLQQPVPFTLAQHIVMKFAGGMLAGASETQRDTYEGNRSRVEANSSWTVTVR